MHFFIWKKKHNFPKHSKESRLQSQPPYPHSQFSQASATGNTVGSLLTDIPRILLSCAHEKEQAEKRERERMKRKKNYSRLCMWKISLT